MYSEQDDEIIYPVTIKGLQSEAIVRIGRRLTEDELYTAKKCIEWGLASVIDITMKVAIEEAVAKATKPNIT